MPVSPLNRDCDYRCDSCDALVTGEEVSNKFREAEIMELIEDIIYRPDQIFMLLGL